MGKRRRPTSGFVGRQEGKEMGYDWRLHSRRFAKGPYGSVEP
jgi:hypothetical protein